MNRVPNVATEKSSHTLALKAWAGLAAAAALLPLLGLIAIGINPPSSGFAAPAALGLDDLMTQIGPDGNPEPGPLPRSLLLALLVCPAALALGTALAFLQHRCDYPGRKLLGLAGLLPFALPSYLIAMTLRDALSPGGFASFLYGEQNFLGLFPAAFVLTLATAPYAQILIGSSLLGLGCSEDEAARSLGATAFQRFSKITLPRLRPALTQAFVLILLYTIADFGVVDILDFPVLTWSIYQAWQDQQLGLAVLLGFGVLAITLPLLIASYWFQGQPSAIDRRGQGAHRESSPRTLRGVARLTAYALHLLPVGFGVVLPLAVLADWIFPAAFRAEAWDLGWRDAVIEPALTSLGIAITATSIAILLAFAPAWLVARGRSFWGRGVQLFVYASNALPGILVALGLLSAALAVSRQTNTPWHDQVRQSGLLIMAGLGLRFLAQAFAALQGAIRQLDIRQEESARSLGAKQSRLFRRIQLPVLAPGIAGAAILVGVSIIKELPVTLMLQPRGWSSLSYQLYASYDDGNDMQAGLAGATIALIAVAAQVAVARWRRHV